MTLNNSQSLGQVILCFFLLEIWGIHSKSGLNPHHLTDGLEDIFWNTSNPIFQISNTDHIIDVTPGTLPHQHHQINIICPYYTSQTKETEKHVIYAVDQEEFDTCRILNEQPRIIAYCTEPYKQKLFTLSFRSFSPMPGSLEFQPGHDYHFISTSSPTDLHQRVGGYCSTHNMKVVFKVLDNSWEGEEGKNEVTEVGRGREVQSGPQVVASKKIDRAVKSKEILENNNLHRFSDNDYVIQTSTKNVPYYFPLPSSGGQRKVPFVLKDLQHLIFLVFVVFVNRAR